MLDKMMLSLYRCFRIYRRKKRMLSANYVLTLLFDVNDNLADVTSSLKTFEGLNHLISTETEGLLNGHVQIARANELDQVVRHLFGAP